MRATPGVGHRSLTQSAQWEQPPCPLCGGRRSMPVQQAQDARSGAQGLWYAIARCGECGMAFTAPRPRQLSPVTSVDHRAIRTIARRPRIAERHQLPAFGAQKLLDLGNDLPFTQRMRRQGWSITTGMRAPAGERFDAVTLWDTLERLADPLDTLRTVADQLAAGGVVLLTVPNYAAWSARRFGAHWTGLDLPRHLHHFTPATLRRLLEKAGLGVRILRQIPRPAWLRRSAHFSAQHGDGLARMFTVPVIARAAAHLAAWSYAGEQLFVRAGRDVE